MIEVIRNGVRGNKKFMDLATGDAFIALDQGFARSDGSLVADGVCIKTGSNTAIQLDTDHMVRMAPLANVKEVNIRVEVIEGSGRYEG